MIAIVDYGMGNLGSIQNMLLRIGVSATVTSDPTTILTADKLILPGVGAFDLAMTNLADRGLIQVLHDKVILERSPVLGICLGMQLFTERSEEGSLPGLGWIKGETVRFRFDANVGRVRLPHMGWNTVTEMRNNPVLGSQSPDSRYYFVHTYYVKCAEDETVLGVTRYCGVDFHSVIGRANIVGTQFHPEKSHKYGMRLLRRFVEHPVGSQ